MTVETLCPIPIEIATVHANNESRAGRAENINKAVIVIQRKVQGSSGGPVVVVARVPTCTVPCTTPNDGHGCTHGGTQESGRAGGRAGGSSSWHAAADGEAEAAPPAGVTVEGLGLGQSSTADEVMGGRREAGTPPVTGPARPA